MKRGKKYQEALKKYNKDELYEVDKALELVKEMAFAKFDETIELCINLSLKKNFKHLKLMRQYWKSFDFNISAYNYIISSISLLIRKK